MRFRSVKVFPEATFDLTAMIDVVLLLIIFFTLSSQFQQSQQKPKELPALAGETTPYEPEASIVVDMGPTGELTVLGGRVISGEELAAEVKRAGKGDGSVVTLIIRAEAKMPAGYLNKLAGVLAAGGVRKWDLATSGEEGAGGGGGFEP